MGVWGDTVIENGIRFVPHIKTPPFDLRVPSDVVDTIVILDYAKDVTDADVVALKKKYIGQSFSEVRRKGHSC